MAAIIMQQHVIFFAKREKKQNKNKNRTDLAADFSEHLTMTLNKLRYNCRTAHSDIQVSPKDRD